MRKLGDTKTVRVFVPMPEDMRDKFQTHCGEASMAGVIRDMVAEKIASKPPMEKTK